MVGIFGQKVTLGQANGPDIELVVSGTELYATYETVEGHSAVYDDSLGLFCYARIVNGSFESTGIPATSPPPEGAVLHGRETDAVRGRKIQERERQMGQRSQKAEKE